MKHVMSLLLFITLSITLQCQAIDLLQRMREQTASQAVGYPGNFNTFITNLYSNGNFKEGTIPIALLGRFQEMFQVEPEVAAQFEAMEYSQEMTYQAFSITISLNAASIKEYVGAAYVENETIHFAYVFVTAGGSLQTQYDTIHEKKCKRKLGIIKKCKTITRTVPRGFTAGEINVVTIALRAKAYETITQKIASRNSIEDFIMSNASKQEVQTKSKGKYILDQSLYPILINKEKSKQSLSFLNEESEEELIWNTYDMNQGPYRLISTDDENVIIFDKSMKPVWDLKKKHQLKDYLLLENYRHYSSNGKYFLLMGKDGNLGIYEEEHNANGLINKPIWETGIDTRNDNQGPFTFEVSNDGEMKVSGGDGKVYWRTSFQSNDIKPKRMQVSKEGKISIINDDNSLLWSS